MIYFGTSGFSYKDWVGYFYPDHLPQREWLAYYAREFNTCEINSTYYAIPRPSMLGTMVEKTGDGFLFCIKANQEMTHNRGDNEHIYEDFYRALGPVISSGRLGCILAQFPYSFKFNHQNMQYLELMRGRLGGLPLVVEFRNAQWLKKEVFEWLRKHNLGFCCVDEPPLANLLPPIAEVTGKTGYVRFHGRNSDKWWNHEQAYERYDYSYNTDELGEWLPKIRKIDSEAEKTFIFANNHWRGQSVNTIRQLRQMLN